MIKKIISGGQTGADRAAASDDRPGGRQIVGIAHLQREYTVGFLTAVSAVAALEGLDLDVKVEREG